MKNEENMEKVLSISIVIILIATLILQQILGVYSIIESLLYAVIILLLIEKRLIHKRFAAMIGKLKNNLSLTFDPRKTNSHPINSIKYLSNENN